MSTFDSMETTLKRNTLMIDKRLSELLPPAESRPSELHQAMRYSCLAPGKRLRPSLVLASCGALRQETELSLDAACAVEMIHAFSLIHDDLPALDNDDLRRGRPTCHVQYGEAVAILAGDALFAQAFEVVSQCSEDPVTINRVLRSLVRAVGTNGLVGGETVDILSEGRPIDRETLEFIHTRKTGALIVSSCEIGGILGGGTPEQIDALKTYGSKVGLAFQVADDVLNETSTPEALGKSAGSDRERLKATYPALYGLEESQKLALQLVEEAIEEISGFENPDLLSDIARFSVLRLN